MNKRDLCRYKGSIYRITHYGNITYGSDRIFYAGSDIKGVFKRRNAFSGSRGQISADIPPYVVCLEAFLHGFKEGKMKLATAGLQIEKLAW